MFPSIPKVLKRKSSMGMTSYKGDSQINSVEKVYHMLTPKPKTLLQRNRELVKHGELTYFSPNTMSKKPRYFFLFNDCLLITKRTGQNKFLLRLWMYLRGGVKIYSMPDSPNYEFRILVPVKGSVKTTKQRRLIIYGRTKDQKDSWVNEIAHCLWVCAGKQGPDPSSGGYIAGNDDDKDDEKKDHHPRPKTTGAKKKVSIESNADSDDENLEYGSDSDGEDPPIEDLNDANTLISFNPFPAGGASTSTSKPTSTTTTPSSQPQPSQPQPSAPKQSNDLFGEPFDPFKKDSSQASSAGAPGQHPFMAQHTGAPGQNPGMSYYPYPYGYPGYPYGVPGQQPFMGQPSGVQGQAYPYGIPPGYIQTPQGLMPMLNPYGQYPGVAGQPVYGTPTQGTLNGAPSAPTSSGSSGSSGSVSNSLAGLNLSPTTSQTGSGGFDLYGNLGQPTGVGLTTTSHRSPPTSSNQSSGSGSGSGSLSAGLAGLNLGSPSSGNSSSVSSSTLYNPIGAGVSGVSGSGYSSSSSSGGIGYSSNFTALSSGSSGVTSAGVLPIGAINVPLESSNEVGLDQLAQNELIQATKLIEELTKALALRPRKTEGKAPDADINMDDVSDAILEATQAIARAASVLLNSAAVAQRERVLTDFDQAQQARTPYHADPIWAQGLISAARYVVATTQNLINTADSSIRGQGKEETLIAAAQSVTSATAQLVAAHRAKGDINSVAHQGLETAAKGITKATAQLVHAAKLASQKQAEMTPEPEPRHFSLTEKEVVKLEKKAKVLELEKETERLREELGKLNKDEYGH